MKKRFCIFWSMATALLIIIPAVGQAHKVIVFAWAQDGKIHIEGSFGSNRMARNCQLTVEDDQGRLIHSARTDQDGTHAFEIPKPVSGDLHIALEAGEGHKGSWTLKKDEIIGADTQQSLNNRHQQKEAIDASPSLTKIGAGIIIIFLLAAALGYVKKKKV